MKRRIVLNAPIDKLFPALISPTVEGYKMVKKKDPTDDELKHGLTYQIEVQGSKPKRYATVKVLKYDKPNVYSMEYSSSAYHKIDTVWLKEVAPGKTEVITEHMEERIKDGKVISSKGKNDSDVIKPVSIWDRHKYKQLEIAIKKGLI